MPISKAVPVVKNAPTRFDFYDLQRSNELLADSVAAFSYSDLEEKIDGLNDVIEALCKEVAKLTVAVDKLSGRMK